MLEEDKAGEQEQEVSWGGESCGLGRLSFLGNSDETLMADPDRLQHLVNNALRECFKYGVPASKEDCCVLEPPTPDASRMKTHLSFVYFPVHSRHGACVWCACARLSRSSTATGRSARASANREGRSANGSTFSRGAASVRRPEPAPRPEGGTVLSQRWERGGGGAPRARASCGCLA